MFGPVDLARTKISQQWLASAENVQRKEAVVPVVAMEETAFLLAMNWVVGGIKV